MFEKSEKKMKKRHTRDLNSVESMVDALIDGNSFDSFSIESEEFAPLCKADHFAKESTESSSGFKRVW